MVVCAQIAAPSASAGYDLPPEFAGHNTVIPKMDVTIATDAFKHRVCVSGSLRSTFGATAPTWTAMLQGTRSDGLAFEASFGTPTVSPTLVLACYDVLKGGTSSGSYVVTVTYVGFGEDLPSAGAAAGAWAPGFPDLAQQYHQ